MEIIKQLRDESTGPKKTLYEKITLVVMSLVVLLLPVFIVPYTNIGFSYAKFGLVTMCVLVASITLVLQVLGERKIERYSFLNYALMFSLPIVYAVSSLFTIHSGSSLMGNGAENDTAYMIFLGVMLMYLVSRAFQSKYSVYMLILGFVSISSLVSIFHISRFVFGNGFLSFGLFGSLISNTVGSFSELGIYAGLAVLLSMLALELTSVRKYLRVLLCIALVLSLALVSVSNFNLLGNIFGLSFGISVSFVIALFSLVVFAHKKVVNPKHKLPGVSLFVLFVSLVLTIASVPISNFFTKEIGINPSEIVDVRVSPLATYGIASHVYGEGVKSALLGVGPNNFFTAWGRYKPVGPENSVNATSFWNVDFNLGSGFIPTSSVTTGILGSLAWCFFLVMVLYYISRLIRAVVRHEKDSASVFTAWSVSMGTLYLWIIAFLYTPSSTLLFLAFAFTGLLFGTLVRENIIKTKIVSWDLSTYWRGFILTLVMILLVAVFMYIGYVWQQRAYASTQVQRAIAILQADNTKITESQSVFLNALNTYFNSSDLRLISEISLIRPTDLITKSQGIVSADKLTQDVMSDITLAVNAARRASVDQGLSVDYRDWLELGKVYETATFLGATSTATLAVQAYAEAERLNPTSPIPPFLIGRIYSLARSFDMSEIKLKRSLELKPDYAEAISLLNAISTTNSTSERNIINKPQNVEISNTTASSSVKTETKSKKVPR